MPREKKRESLQSIKLKNCRQIRKSTGKPVSILFSGTGALTGRGAKRGGRLFQDFHKIAYDNLIYKKIKYEFGLKYINSLLHNSST